MQSMPAKARLFTLFLASSIAACAATVDLPGPTMAMTGNVLTGTPGTPCPSASTPGCIIGSPLSYEVFDVKLTQPTTMGGPWSLVIDTNYPLNFVPSLPTSTIPPSAWEDMLLYSMPDFIIHWNGNNYDIVLAAHEIQSMVLADGYTAGNVYLATGYTTSGQALNNPSSPATPSPNPSVPVWLAAGGSQFGTGSLNVTALGNGSSAATYQITETFTVTDPNWLSTGTFTVQASSYTCDNGLLIESAQFPTTQIPEPSTLFMAMPVLAMFARRVITTRRRPRG